MKVPGWAVVGFCMFTGGLIIGEVHGHSESYRIEWGAAAFMVVLAAAGLGVAVWLKSRPKQS